ncbi:MAG TPA: VOC family protein [Candidatus Chromulinivoraceae bacterium]|nr:VOC family protein [Candidatus Chromulinivoraceae bacterium]
MSKATPYFLFDGNCEEAMQFYQKCFGGDLAITKVNESPMKAQFTPEQQNRVVNSRLVSNGIEFSASDWLLPQRARIEGTATCAYISEASYDELKHIFEQLSIGANQETLDELRAMPFGSYGALTDKYGVRWMFQGEGKA